MKDLMEQLNNTQKMNKTDFQKSFLKYLNMYYQKVENIFNEFNESFKKPKLTYLEQAKNSFDFLLEDFPYTLDEIINLQTNMTEIIKLLMFKSVPYIFSQCVNNPF